MTGLTRERRRAAARRFAVGLRRLLSPCNTGRCPSARSSNAGPRRSGLWPSASTGQGGVGARGASSSPWRCSSPIGSATGRSLALHVKRFRLSAVLQEAKAERIRLSYAVSAADSKSGSAYSAVLPAPRLASLACVASACRCNPIALNRASASARRSWSLRAIPRARAANGAT